MSTLCASRNSKVKSGTGVDRRQNLFAEPESKDAPVSLKSPIVQMNDEIFVMSPDTKSPENTRKRLHYSSSSVGSSADSHGEPKNITPLTDTFLKRAKIIEQQPQATKPNSASTKIDTPPATTKPSKKKICASRDEIHADLMMQCDKQAHRVFQTSCGYDFGALPMSLVRADATQEILTQLEDTLSAICDTSIDEHTYEQCILLHSRLINILASVSNFCDEVQEKMKKRADAKNK